MGKKRPTRTTEGWAGEKKSVLGGGGGEKYRGEVGESRNFEALMERARKKKKNLWV